jgi:hypothetical protein
VENHQHMLEERPACSAIGNAEIQQNRRSGQVKLFCASASSGPGHLKCTPFQTANPGTPVLFYSRWAQNNKAD